HVGSAERAIDDGVLKLRVPSLGEEHEVIVLDAVKIIENMPHSSNNRFTLPREGVSNASRFDKNDVAAIILYLVDVIGTCLDRRPHLGRQLAWLDCFMHQRAALRQDVHHSPCAMAAKPSSR